MANLNDILKKVKKNLGKVCQEPIARSASSVVQAQHVFSGQLRASTNIGVNSPDLSIVEVANYQRNAVGRTQQLADSNFRSVTSKIKPGDVVYISNNQPYGLAHEFTHSTLAFTKAASNFSNEVNKYIREIT